eukprot:TRINITY_DN38145_c0_g1_i1.p1 TRINITY_DN38145_c0_g1~~TRINITY_DN38145_c0_g1_i1.p1  ORF type:complete len:620 (+),score=112.42 TRINITY_DN38145_c0_g1_i1:15-1874(+)
MSKHESAKGLSAADRVLSGAVAGAVSRSVTAPLDRVRILYQVNPHREFSMRAAFKTAKTIYASTGIPGLWRGNGAALVRVMPYSGVLFCCYPSYENGVKSLQWFDHNKVATRFAAGALAGATATTLTYPLDLLRARMAAHWGPVPLYSGYIEGIQTIVKNEGVSALFHGIRPTLYGIVPYSGVGFMTFETMKSAMMDGLKLQTDQEIPTTYRLFAGGVSGIISQAVTYPLHVVRRRMQVGGAVHSGMSLTEALRTIFRTEGIHGLLKGITLTYAKGPVSVALGFTLNDILKSNLIEIRAARPHGIMAGKTHQEIEEGERKLSALESLVAGAIAGCAAKTTIAPADRIKINFQVGNQRYTFMSAVNLGREVVKTQGFFALWRGNGATLIRVIPYSGTTYFTYDKYLYALSYLGIFKSEKPTALQLFTAGSLAGVTATALTYPLDLLRARMAVDLSHSKKGYRHAFWAVVGDEGYHKLFAGLRPTLCGIIPYAGLSFMTFETLKASIKDRLKLKRDRDIPTPLRLMAGGFAGLAAQSATYPLDIIRRRMQTAKLPHHLSLHVAIRTVLVQEGWRSLYRGLSMNWLKGPVAISISFTTNDTIKTHLRDWDITERVRERLGTV